MTHLTAADLKSWYEHGRDEDRDRVIGHLAECTDCRRALSALAIADEAPVSAPAVTTEEVVPLGYAARHPSPAASWLGWLRPAYGLAGAVVIVLAVLWLTRPGAPAIDDAVRGTELVAMTPTGSVNDIEFKWQSPFEASAYRVVVRDTTGVLIFNLETNASSVKPEPAMRARLTVGETYSWQVTALDRAGSTIAESRVATFRVQP